MPAPSISSLPCDEGESYTAASELFAGWSAGSTEQNGAVDDVLWASSALRKEGAGIKVYAHYRLIRVASKTERAAKKERFYRRFGRV